MVFRGTSRYSQLGRDKVQKIRTKRQRRAQLARQLLGKKTVTREEIRAVLLEHGYPFCTPSTKSSLTVSPKKKPPKLPAKTFQSFPDVDPLPAGTWVTAYTDASFRAGKGGWAIWLRSSAGRVVRRGECPLSICDSTEAELYAVLQAVKIAVEVWPTTCGVLINSDCKGILRALWPWSPPLRRASLHALQDTARHFIEAHGIRIRTKRIRSLLIKMCVPTLTRK